MKREGLLIGLLLIFSVVILFNSSFVNAQDPDFGSSDKREGELTCLQCGDGCAPYDFVVVAMCAKPTRELNCGVRDKRCVILGEEPDDCGGVDCDDIELGVSPGTTPDSIFYFLDELFDGFGDQLAVREEKVAEIKAMIEAGKIDAARTALENYIKKAEMLEKEVNPDQIEEAKKSAAAIRNALKELEEQIPEEDRDDFVDGVIQRERDITTAVEISSKIKELCLSLSELDPIKYGEVCISGDDSPKWQKKLDGELTNEQEQEAKEFGQVMSQCFKTSGKDCACDEISFYDFSVACSKAAPLAVACDIDGDENACERLEALNMPKLPPYLQDVLYDVESKYDNAQYDMHMPPECVEEGATTPKECSKVMVKLHAPPECKAALLAADISSESEGRAICDEIMFKQHTPKECIDEGITDPDACAEYMDNYRDPDGPMEPGSGDFGRQCMEIEEPLSRLACFENAVGIAGEHFGPGPGVEGEGELTWQCKEHRIHWAPDCETFMRDELPLIEKQKAEEHERQMDQEYDWRVLEKECAASCDLEQGWWDFKDGECTCTTGDYDDSPRPDDEWQGGSCDNCASECGEQEGQRLRSTNCENGHCVCEWENIEEGEGSGEPSDYETEISIEIDPGTTEESVEEPSVEESTTIEESDSDGGSESSNGGEESSGNGESEESSGESESSGGSEESGGSSPITGNAFLNYYFRRY